jgi:hypothetical protein
MKAAVQPMLALLLALAAAAAAQPQSRPADGAQPPQMTRQEKAKREAQEAEMTRAAQQVMALVDAGRIGEVWDGASSAMKRAVPRDEFTRQVTIDRKRLGTPRDRGIAVVTRIEYPAGARVPQGLYINVATPTTFANAQQPVRELVSFRLDEDRTWRVSGYSLR